eukprot:6172393-Pleurochrysis_carterae.AAC.2
MHPKVVVAVANVAVRVFFRSSARCSAGQRLARLLLPYCRCLPSSASAMSAVCRLFLPVSVGMDEI